MARSPRNLDEVKRNFEQILADASDTGESNGTPSSEPATASELSSQSTITAAARRLTETCNAAAADIQKTGEDAVQIASGLAAETEALAELLRRHGVSIANRIEEFTTMTMRIQTTVSSVRTEISSTTGSLGPPLSSSS